MWERAARQKYFLNNSFQPGFKPALADITFRGRAEASGARLASRLPADGKSVPEDTGRKARHAVRDR